MKTLRNLLLILGGFYLGLGCANSKLVKGLDPSNQSNPPLQEISNEYTNRFDQLEIDPDTSYNDTLDGFSIKTGTFRLPDQLFFNSYSKDSLARNDEKSLDGAVFAGYIQAMYDKKINNFLISFGMDPVWRYSLRIAIQRFYYDGNDKWLSWMQDAIANYNGPSKKIKSKMLSMQNYLKHLKKTKGQTR